MKPEKSVFLLSILLLMLASACKKDDNSAQAQTDEKIITDYIAAHNLPAQRTASGLYYVIINPGTGTQPVASSIVTVSYKGYLTNGTVFDHSTSAGITFGLSQVIKGWQEGIPKFKKGGNGILLIPSALGYGKQSSGSIPANAVLIFEVKLISVR